MLNQKRTVTCLLIAIVCLSPITLIAQCANVIDLNTWYRIGPSNTGTWNVNAAGTQVHQTINGFPSFFISPEDFINVRITGTLRSAGTDDDFIGFIFGHRTPTTGAANAFLMQSYLFDWVQVPKNGPNTQWLNRIDGNVDVTGNWQPWWNHSPDPAFTQLGAVAAPGWVRNVNYNFELVYLYNRVIIRINGATVFDVNGCFEPGRFGFYNFSQADVYYSNFAYELLPDFGITATNVCLNDSASFFFVDNSCGSAAAAANTISQFNWSFGDGNTSNAVNPKHLYAAPGIYTVSLVITDNFGCVDSVSKQITVVPLPPTPSTTQNGPICEGSTLNLTGNGGVGVSYSWTGPNGFTSNQQNPSINNAPPAATGTYTLTTSNGTCSSAGANQAVTVHPTPPTPTPSSNGPICAGSTLNLSANNIPGASYNWTGPNGFSSNLQNPTLASSTTNATGVYNVTAVVNGCPSNVGNVSVAVNAIPNVVVSGDNTICLGETTTLIANGASTYSWNNGATTANNVVGPSTTTTYIVTGTSSAGCVSSPASYPVTVNNPPAVNLGVDTIVCDQYTLDAGTGGTLSYAWNTGANSQTISVTNTGNYQVTVTNTDSCFSVDNINVTIDVTPSVAIVGDTVICDGDNTTLFAVGANNYNWSNGDMGNSTTVSPTTNTTYSVVGVSPLGCQAPPEFVSVTVNALPVVNLGPDLTVCDSVTIDAGPAGTLSYAWSNGATTRNILVTSSGTYQVTVMNTDSCMSVDQINVTVNPTVQANLGADQDICPGQSVFLTPGAFATYNWSTGDSTPLITAISTGTYYVDVIDGNGCPSSDTMNLNVWPLLTGDVGANTLICDGDTLPIDASNWAGATYSWAPGGQTTAAINATTPDLYIVTIDDGNGCIYTDSLDLAVDFPPALSITVSDTLECEGAPISFTVTPGGLPDYNFFLNGNSQQAGTGTDYTITTLQNGDNISVTGTTQFGCTTSANSPVAVTILPRPTGTVLVDSVCDGTPSTFTVSPQNATSVTWAGGGGFSGNTNTVVYQFVGPATYPYTVTLDQSGQCDTTIAGIAVVNPIPFPPVAPELIACTGDNPIMNATGGGTVEWFDSPTGGNVVNVGNDFNFTNVTPATNDSFWVQQTELGCVSPRTQTFIEVLDIPVADFISDPDTTIILNIPNSTIQFVNLSTSANSYEWDFGDGSTSSAPSPSHNYDQEGLFYVTLIAFINAGCVDTIQYGPYEIVDFDEFHAPNAFTPNGDGDNDTWVIDDLYFYPDNTLMVFNRWGKTVFEVQGYQNNWDGTWNGKPLPEGTYYYVIDLGEGFQTVKGFVTLYR